MSRIWTAVCTFVLFLVALSPSQAQTNYTVGQPAYYWQDGSWKRSPTPSQAAVGIGQPNNTIGKTTIGIGQNSTGIGKPTIGIGQNRTGIGQPTIGIGQNNTGIGKPTIGIGQNSTGIGKATIGIGQNSTGIGQPTIGIGKPTIGIGQNNTGIGQPNTSIGRPTIGIGQQPNSYRVASAPTWNASAGSRTNWHRAPSPNHYYPRASRTNNVARAYTQRANTSN